MKRPTLSQRLSFVAFGLALILTARAFSTEYYVDSQRGDDKATGASPQTAWRSLDRVSNAQELQPGDVVRFHAGDVWRGGLKPRSGAEGRPILYTSYGEGLKPSFWRSVSLASERDWVKVGDNLWATRPNETRVLADAKQILAGKWSLHHENGAKVKYETSGGKFVLTVEASGSAGNHIQWFNSPFKIESGHSYRISFDLLATNATGATISLMSQGAPYSNYGSVVGKLQASETPTRQSIIITAKQDADDARLTFYLGTLPTGARLEFSNFKADEVELDALQLAPDVGNIILNGDRAAWKRWTIDDLKAQDDFCYERGEGRVWYYSETNPAKRYKTMEAAVMRHIVDLSGVTDAIFDGLDLRYGAAHGFGGSGNARITIRNCDLAWIGGGDQYQGGGDGRRVRFGNAIEFWANARDHIVEKCRIWEVYDAALTNQGSGTNVERNIVYRNNVIWNCEYSFEYWNRDETSVTENIQFVGNLCMNAGYGWGHAQRPDPNGRCLMFYSNSAQTRNVLIRGNTFANATESLVRSDIDWTPENPKLTENVYWQDNPDAVYALWLKQSYKGGIEAFQKERGQEAGGRVEKIDVTKLIPTDVRR